MSDPTSSLHVELRNNGRMILATLIMTDDDRMVGIDEIGLAEPAFRRFEAPEGSLALVTPPRPPESPAHCCALARSPCSAGCPCTSARLRMPLGAMPPSRCVPSSQLLQQM
jgi:hypothetical protein